MHSGQPLVLGVSGISGSGKTFIIDQLVKQYPDKITVLGFDDYYRPLHEQWVDENGYPNFDLPTALYQEKYAADLAQLISGKSIFIAKYNFENYDAERRVEQLHPSPVIIAEGLYVFEIGAVNQKLHGRILVECEAELCLSRRLHRDETERGISRERSLYQWHNHVQPSYQQHILPYKAQCDLIIENDMEAAVNLQPILTVLQTKASDWVKSALGF